MKNVHFFANSHTKILQCFFGVEIGSLLGIFSESDVWTRFKIAIFQNNCNFVGKIQLLECEDWIKHCSDVVDGKTKKNALSIASCFSTQKILRSKKQIVSILCLLWNTKMCVSMFFLANIFFNWVCMAMKMTRNMRSAKKRVRSNARRRKKHQEQDRKDINEVFILGRWFFAVVHP